MADHKDYSGTPLWKKLGIVAGSRVHVAAAPPGFAEALGSMAPLPDGVTFLGRPGADLDVVMLFVTHRSDLTRSFPRAVGSIGLAGKLWVAWPKKASRIDTDLDFETVQAIGLGAELVDNKSASVTEVFQGLQFVYRLKARAR